MIILSCFILIYLALRGLIEGMVMTRYTDIMCNPDARDDDDGVRCHVWFKWYHVACLVRDGVPIAILLTLLHAWSLITLGIFIMGWELSELAYNYARYGKLFIPHENIMGIKNVDGKNIMLYINIVRTIIGLAFVLIGMFLT